VSLVALGASSADELDSAVQAFEAAGFRSETELIDPGAADVVVALGRDAAERLLEADRQGVRYQLVHVGADDGLPGGSFARAHHRLEIGSVEPLARRLKSGARLRVRLLAFGYKHGLPASADWVIDARFLKNPYWVEELRHLDGREPRVREYVLGQAAAVALVDGLAALFTTILPLYRAQGRTELTIAFGCTGGRHRSVALAEEMARRLGAAVDADIESGFREL